MMVVIVFVVVVRAETAAASASADYEDCCRESHTHTFQLLLPFVLLAAAVWGSSPRGERRTTHGKKPKENRD